MYLGDVITFNVTYAGKLSRDPKFTVSDLKLDVNEYLSLVDAPSEPCFKGYYGNRWRNRENYEEVIDQDWFRSSDYICGYWVKNKN